VSSDSVPSAVAFAAIVDRDVQDGLRACLVCGAMLLNATPHDAPHSHKDPVPPERAGTVVVTSSTSASSAARPGGVGLLAIVILL
jgi:hypothetical protein